jgi:MFS family permease
VERKLLVQGGQAILAMVTVAVAVSVLTGTATWVHLLAAAMLQGAAIAFMAPARQALIPQLVGRESIGNAVALNASVMGLAALTAPAVAGVLYYLIGPAGVYFLVAASGLTALGFTIAVRVNAPGPGRVNAPVLADVKAGLSYVRRNRLVMVHLGVALAAVLLAMPIQSLLPVLVVDVFHQESGALGLLVSMMGLGSLVGSLLIASMGNRRRGVILVLGAFLAGIALLLVALLPWYLVTVVIMAFLGLGIGSNMTLNHALLMEEVDERYRGRVMSILLMTFGLIPLGVLPAGLAIDIVGSQAVIGALGVAMLATTTVVWFTQKELRRLQ